MRALSSRTRAEPDSNISPSYLRSTALDVRGQLSSRRCAGLFQSFPFRRLGVSGADLGTFMEYFFANGVRLVQVVSPAARYSSCSVEISRKLAIPPFPILKGDPFVYQSGASGGRRWETNVCPAVDVLVRQKARMASMPGT